MEPLNDRISRFLPIAILIASGSWMANLPLALSLERIGERTPAAYAVTGFLVGIVASTITLIHEICLRESFA